VTTYHQCGMDRADHSTTTYHTLPEDRWFAMLGTELAARLLYNNETIRFRNGTSFYLYSSEVHQS